jgi:FKBP-type peptidyl-prolyl cis-trans isomerase SlyD
MVLWEIAFVNTRAAHECLQHISRGRVVEWRTVGRPRADRSTGDGMEKPIKVDDGHVVSMHYSLHVDGTLVDSSSGGEPLRFIEGMGHIIPGLEHELYDMQIGDRKTITVHAKDGYGERDAAAFMDVPRDAFPTDVPLEAGTELELQDHAGHPVYARIDGMDDANVRLDLNHPLAGKDLHFEVSIAGLRPATEEEVTHGHVHDENHIRESENSQLSS